MSYQSSPKPSHQKSPIRAFEGSIDHDITQRLRAIARVADQTDTKVYLVGGLVREFVARVPTINTLPDIATIGEAAILADALVDQLPNCSLKSVSQFHTAKIDLGGIPIDIASARTDTYEPWGSLPQITLVDDIETDLARRDFTINAMAIPLLPSSFGNLIDPYSGRKDATDGDIRVLHSASFREDPLRMLRGVRLAARYDYSFETRTADLLAQSLDNLRTMTESSPQRVFNEFRLWFQSHENLAKLTSIAQTTGLLTALGITTDIPHNVLHRINQNANETQRFAAFAYNIPDDALNDFVTRLQAPNHWRTIAQHVNKIRTATWRCRDPEFTDTELHRALIGINNQVLSAIISVEPDTTITTRLIDFQSRLRHVHNFLNGDDLIAVGVEEGPMVGQLLEELQTLRIEGQLHSADDERRYIIRRLSAD